MYICIGLTHPRLFVCTQVAELEENERISLYICISICLSLSLYIYIYVYTHTNKYISM